MGRDEEMKINDERVKDITILVDGYIVGGAVRDYLLGKPIYDWDISTPKTPDEVIKLLQDNGFKTILTGAKYGTVSTIVDGIQHPVEITTFRSEKYNNSRFPEVVYHTTQKGDSMRRDFTINAMAYDVRNDKILDYYGGMEDIKSRTIRFVGEPIERIKEDPLRIIRACRIAATLGFRMDEDTSNALMEIQLKLRPGWKGITLCM
jgi:tRNA nucleotidyltransferase (CCA-adding enzyme)